MVTIRTTPRRGGRLPQQPRHVPDRAAVRHGTEDGAVVLGGRKVRVRRPRVRTADRSTEVPVAAYETFSSGERLGELALAKMMAKLSTRRYAAGLEPVGSQAEAAASATSRSAVSRRFVTMTERALNEMMHADLSELDLVAVMADGVHFGEHLCVVALGITIDGIKVPLGLVEGTTENATVVTELLTGLRDRGLDVTRPVLVVIDGGKALARSLEKAHPGAAGSLREGLAEPFTVGRLGVAPALARSLRSTNPIESMIGIGRDHSSNVKRWRDGTMALRWCAAGMVEAAKQFRRVQGHHHLPALRAALNTHFNTHVTRSCDTAQAA